MNLQIGPRDSTRHKTTEQDMLWEIEDLAGTVQDPREEFPADDVLKTLHQLSLFGDKNDRPDRIFPSYPNDADTRDASSAATGT